MIKADFISSTGIGSPNDAMKHLKICKQYYEEYFKCDELTEIAIKFFNCMKYLNWEILDRFSSALGWINSEAYTIRIHTTRKYESDRILEKL